MTDHNGNPQPQQPDPRAWEIPERVPQSPPVPQAPAPAVVPAPRVPQPAQAAQVPPAHQVPQVFRSERAWVDGYEPGNPWQARLCVETPYGTFAYPLTPNTIPELLEQMVLVAQEQQGLPVGIDDDDPSPLPAEGEEDDEEQQGVGTRLQGGRAARLSGWAVVHDLWEREDPTARIVMGAVVVTLLVLGIFLT